MTVHIARELPRLLSVASAWASAEAARAALNPRRLNPEERATALRVGVVAPDRVRIKLVTEMPQPHEAELRSIASQMGRLGPGMVGLTLGYTVLILTGHMTNRLLAHELRHVQQYEAHGSIASFLQAYLA
jgi:hypothetical protein